MHGRQSCGGRPGVNAINIGHDRQPAETGNEIAQNFESLASKIGLLVCQAGDVAIRSRQIRDQASANRVPQYEDAAAFRSASDNRSGGEAFSSGAWLAAPALRAIKLDCGRSPVSQLEIVVFELDRPVGEPYSSPPPNSQRTGPVRSVGEVQRRIILRPAAADLPGPPRPSFGLRELLVASHIFRLASRDAAKPLLSTLVSESFGECRAMSALASLMGHNVRFDADKGRGHSFAWMKDMSHE